MADTTSLDNELVSPPPTAASILGIKGNLRFRPHGSSQKAHVVLRRIEPDSDSEGEDDSKGVVQFSLFAYKRIEVKPGKEILLTVADGPFKDRAIIFEGDEHDTSSLSEAEEETQVAEEDDAFMPPDHSLPLKMRKPWARRMEEPIVLAPEAPEPTPKPTYNSIGTQTYPTETPTHPPAVPPNSAHTEEPQPIISTVEPDIAAPINVSFPEPPTPQTIVAHHETETSAESQLAVVATSPKVEAMPSPNQPEHERSLSPMEIDSPPSSPSPPVEQLALPASEQIQQDVTLAEVPVVELVETKPQRWSPSIPAPVALPVSVKHVDEIHEAAASSSSSEDLDSKPLPRVPERPWSPSVPAASSILSRKRLSVDRVKSEQRGSVVESNQAKHAAEPPASPPRPPAPTVTPPPAPPSPSAKVEPPAPIVKPKPKFVNPFVSGGFMTDFVGKPCTVSSPSKEETQQPIPPLEKAPPPPPPSVPPPPEPDSTMPPPPPAIEPPVTPSLSTLPTHPPSPTRRDHSPSRFSSASSRGSFSHGLPDSSSTSVPSHPSSPKVPVKKPQGLSWPPFRPSPTEGSTDFDPPFRAGPDFSEPPPPSTFRPAAGPSTITTHVPPHTPTATRPPLTTPSPHSMSTGPRYTQQSLSSVPAGPLSPAAPPYHPGPFMSPLLPPQYLPKPPSSIPDRGYLTRPPRLDATLPITSISGNQSIAPKSYNSYNRYHRQPYNRSFDGRGRPGLLPAGMKRKASPPRSDSTTVEVPPRRQPPYSWPAVSPIRCAAVQGDNISIRSIAFDRTGNLLAVVCSDMTIRVWDNTTCSEVARLPHQSMIIAALWMEEDAGVLVLCADGALVRWSRPAGNTSPRGHDVWHWDQVSQPIMNGRPEDAPSALAHTRNRIAVSFPNSGVRIWTKEHGSWQLQRAVTKLNIMALEFVDGGAVLISGSSNGKVEVVWRFDVPLAMRANPLHTAVDDHGLPTAEPPKGVRGRGFVSDNNWYEYTVERGRIIRGIDTLQDEYALVSLQSSAELRRIANASFWKFPSATYKVPAPMEASMVYVADAAFSSQDSGTVVWGCSDGYLLAWDRHGLSITCGLDHGEGSIVQAVGAFRGSGVAPEGCLVTGTQDGKLSWFADPGRSEADSRGFYAAKRVKMS
ncbi:hypothetical protein BC834DRAFT_1035067 [Gloeopeniophorella convolvens]|nr:hypothetical protein BC834DRAFT_1035067 [Gloeopeniophorella convolvens]